MAWNINKGMKAVNCQLKMLVLFILIIYTAHFCQGKALLEESESDKGKGSYGHLPNAGLHQTYDPQSNAEHWMKGKFYQPEVDGQPIYVPAVDQAGSYNEFLDAYYKAYTPAWNRASPVQYTYDTKNTEKAAPKTTPDKKNSFKYTLPTSKPSKLSVDTGPSDDYDLELEDYDDPDIVDKTILTEFTNEKADMTSELEDQELEGPVLESLKSEFTKTKPKDHNMYDMPVVKAVKQKQNTSNARKDLYKNLSTPKGIYKNTVKTVIKDASVSVKYVSPASKESEFSAEMSTSDYDLEYQDYGEPEVIEKIAEAELNEKSDIAPELDGQENFEEPVVRESFKSELTKTKPTDHNQYDIPVVKSVKQKSKPKNSKEDSYKNSSTPKNAYDGTEKTIAKGSDKNDFKYEFPAPKQSYFSVKTNASDLEFVDYDGTQVIDKAILTEFNNQKLDMTSKTENKDEIEEPVLHESLKKTELLKTSKGDSQYDTPNVVKTKQKSKTNTAKKSKQEKQNAQAKPQLDADYEQAQVVKANSNKKPIEIASEQKYSDQTHQRPLKKSKGKRKKQYSKLISKTGEAVDQKVFCSSTVSEDLDALSNTKNEKQKKVVKTKPIKTMDKVGTKQDSQYESVSKVNVALKSKSKGVKPTTHKSSKASTSNENIVVKTDSQYQSIKNKDKVTIESISKDKQEKGSVKYDTGKLENDLLTRKLNSKTTDLSESYVITSNTDNLLDDESDLGGSSDMSENQFSEKLSSESTTIESDSNLKSSNSDLFMKPESIVPNINDFRGLSSMNSNIWSMLFNPNAEQNKLKLKRCFTRSNETGFCTYIQNCEVPHIGTSLEQLLNNACVIDDIFIGVCCPEFPVQTVKVHWDQTQSDFDNPIEDEFGHIAQDCGILSNKALELQSWPWKAPLVSMSNGKIFCGGVVVSEDHVLTAAHCTTKIPKNQILVRLGQYDDESGDDYAVVEIKRHAQYNPRTMQNDIALLKLGRRIMNDAHIGIVCLPDEEPQNNHNGEIATLLGWRGIFGTKSRDPEFLRVISNKECENQLGMKVLGTSLCTETRKESERTCNADSGAPLVIEDDGRYEVIGILSWNRNDCDRRFPSTFSRVSSYTGWIQNHIG